MYTKPFSIIALAVLLIGIASCVFEQPLHPVAQLEPPVNITVLKSPQNIPSNARWYMPDIRYYLADDVKIYSAVIDQVFKEYNDAGSLRFFATSEKDSADIFIEFADLGTIPEKATIGLLPQKYETFEGFQLANYTVEIGEIDFPELFRATIQLNKNLGDRWNQDVVKSALLYQIGKIMGLTDSNSPTSALQKQINISKPISSLSVEDKSRFRGIYDVRETGKWEEKSFSLPLNTMPDLPGNVLAHYMSSINVGNQFYLIYSPTVRPTDAYLYRYDYNSNQFEKIVSTNGRSVFVLNNEIYSCGRNFSSSIVYKLNGTQWDKPLNSDDIGSGFHLEWNFNVPPIDGAFVINNKMYYIQRSLTQISRNFYIQEYDPFTSKIGTSYYPPLETCPFNEDETFKTFGKFLITFANGIYYIHDVSLKKHEILGAYNKRVYVNYPSTLLFGLKNRIYFSNRFLVYTSRSTAVDFTHQVYNPFNKRSYVTKIDPDPKLWFSSPGNYADANIFDLYNVMFSFTVPSFLTFNSRDNAFIIRKSNNRFSGSKNAFLIFTPHKTFSK